jgi:hypothetical protein
VKRAPVRSSVLRSIGYDHAKSVLEVEFVTRLVYRYLRVPHAKFRLLMNAESKGRYFNAHIRDHYDFQAIEIL